MSYVTGKFDGRVVELLKSGAVGFMPSDTMYGISARALDEEAVEKVHMLKLRDSDKPCIVLISDLKMLDMLSIPKNQANAVIPYWPGAISLEFKTPNAPWWLHRGNEFFAIRMPDNRDLLDLISQVGPIISTSANIQGQPPARSVPEAKQTFGEQLDFYVDAGKLDSLPSTLAKVENGKLKVIRQGAVKIKP